MVLKQMKDTYFQKIHFILFMYAFFFGDTVLLRNEMSLKFAV